MAKAKTPRPARTRQFPVSADATPKHVTQDRLAELARDPPGTDDPLSTKGCRWPIGDPATINGGKLSSRGMEKIQGIVHDKRPDGPDAGQPFRYCQRPRAKRLNGETSYWCQGHHEIGHIKQTRARPVDHRPPNHGVAFRFGTRKREEAF